MLTLRAILVGPGLALVMLVSPASSQRPATGKPAMARRKGDVHGDPLPLGAVARLGTVRFRQPAGLYAALPSQDGKTIISAGPAFQPEESAPKSETVQGASAGMESRNCSANSLGTQLRKWDMTSGRSLGRFGPVRMTNARDLPGGMGGLGGGFGGLGGLGGGLGGLGGGLGGFGRGMGGRGGLPVEEEENTAARVFASNRNTLALVNPDQSVDLWDLGRRRPVRQVRRRNMEAEVECMALSPDGRMLACAADGIELWNTRTGKRLRRLAFAEGENTTCLVFSSDCKVLASTFGDTDVRLWNVATGKPIRRWRGIHGARLAFAPDGKVLAVSRFEGEDGASPSDNDEDGGSGFCIDLLDLATAKKCRTLHNLPAATTGLAFAPNGQAVAAVSAEGMIAIWRVPSGKQIHCFKGHAGPVYSVAFTPDGTLLVTAGKDNTIKVWEVATGKERNACPAHWGTVRCLAYSPDGRRLASGSDDGTVRLWDPATGKALGLFLKSGAPVRGLTFLSDGKVLAALFPEDEPACGWDMATGREIRGLRPTTPVSDDPDDVVSPDGKWRATTVTVSTGIDLYCLATGKRIRVCGPGEMGLVRPCFSADSKMLAAFGFTEDDNATEGEEARFFVLWDVASGKQVRMLTNPEFKGADKLAISPEGRWLATENGDRVIRLWQVATGRQVHQITPPCSVACLAFSPDGRTLAAAGGGDYAILVWDITGQLRDGELPTDPLKTDELMAAWEALAGGDAGRAYQAHWALVGRPAQAAAVFRAQLRPVNQPDPTSIRRLVNGLDNARFSVRERARRNLQMLGELAQPSLRKALKQGPPLEVRFRVERLLTEIDNDIRFPRGERLRGLRAVAVLEHVAMPEARKVLRDLAGGAPGASITRQAKAALERLAGRSVGASNRAER